MFEGNSRTLWALKCRKGSLRTVILNHTKTNSIKACEYSLKKSEEMEYKRKNKKYLKLKTKLTT